MAGNKQIAYDITADSSAFVKGMEQASAAVTGATAQIDAQLKRIGDGFGMVQKALMGFTAVLAGGGALKKLIDEAVEWNAAALKMSKQLGLTTEQASVLNVALNHIGVDSATFLTASERLSKNIQQNAQAFQVMGVKVQEASGQYRPMTQVMAEVNEKLAALKNPIEQNIAGQQVYGKGWHEVREILKLTTAGMAEADIRARELGLIVGPEGAAMGKKYTEQMRDLNLVGKAMEVQFGNALLPVFTRMGAVLGTVLPGAANFFGKTLAAVVEMLILLAAKLVYAYSRAGSELAGIAARVAGVFTLRGEAYFTEINDAVREDKIRALKEFVALLQKIQGLGAAGGKPQTTPDTDAKSPHYKFKEKSDTPEESQMGKWTALLAEKKANIQEQAVLDGNFHQMSKEEERKYWQDILATVDVASRDGLAVRRKVAEATQALRKDEYEGYLETLKNEREELQKNFAQRTEVAVKAYRSTVSLYGEESKEAKKAYGEVLAEHRKFVEQQLALEAAASDRRRNQQLADVELERVQVETDLALGVISHQQALAAEMQFEERFTAIRKQALQERKALLIGTDNDPVALAQLNQQIEQVEQQHQQRLAQIRGQSVVESQRTVRDMFAAIESSWANLISKLMSGSLTIGGLLRGMFQSVAQAVINTLAQIAAKWLVEQISTLVMSKLTAAGLITDNAAVAGSAATASAAAIPVYGWAIAPAAGAAAYGSAIAYLAGLTSAAGGYDIPASVNPIVQAHAREMILPAKYSDVIRSLADNGSDGAGAGTLHFHGTPDDSIKARDLAPLLKRMNRNFVFVT